MLLPVTKIENHSSSHNGVLFATAAVGRSTYFSVNRVSSTIRDTRLPFGEICIRTTANRAVTGSMNEPQAPDWRTWIQQGIEVFRKGRSAEAVSWFEKACESSPGTAVPHLYLAIALHQQYIPGALSRENAELGRRAEMELRRAWDLDPQGWAAAALLGQLALAERRFTDAREWYGKALTLQSKNAEIRYMLGVIAWQQGLRNEAIADFEKSVSLDPLRTDAMEYLSRITGGEWLERSYDARSECVQAFLAGAKSVASDSGDPDWLLKTWARAAALSPPPPSPPPPPPPPPPGFNTRRASSSTPTISFDPMPPSNEPPPIRVASACKQAS